MTNLSQCLTLLLFLISSTTSVQSQEDAESIHKRITTQFTNATSLRVTATSSMMNGSSIRITAKKKDKYIIETLDRIICCNGKRIWNYSPARKNVVISNYNTQTGALSLEKLLFEVISSYKPNSLKNNNSSASGGSYLLTLEPHGKELYDVSSIQLSIGKKKLNIEHVKITLGSGIQDWKITSLQTNVGIGDGAFTFKIPKNAEVIDLTE